MIPGKRQDLNSEESNKSLQTMYCSKKMDHCISIHYTSVNQVKITEIHAHHHFIKRKDLHFYSGVFCCIGTF